MYNQLEIKNFWIWFENNHKKYIFIQEVDDTEREKILTELIQELHKYCDGLFFQLGGHPDEHQMELVITAEGITDYFPMVEALVDQAPAIKGWDIIKFKQPQGPGFSTEYRGFVFDPEETIFIPLTSIDAPNAVGILVCYPDFIEAEKEAFINGTFIMLDTLIGEKSTAMDIDYLDVAQTPEEIEEYEFLYMTEIASFIEEKKALDN